MESFSIGEVARQCDLTPQTIRYYEREGLLPAPHRRRNGYRAYTADAVNRLRFIKRAKSLGFSLKETEELLAFSEDSHSTAAEFKAEALAKCREIEQKINDLSRMRRALERLIERCPGDGDKHACPILNALVSD